MKLLTTINEHFDFLESLIDEDTKGVFITSFGIYAGILHDGRNTNEWGEKYKSRAYEFLRLLQKKNIKTKILIGLSDYKSCIKDKICENCEKNYLNQIIRFSNHTLVFKEFDWRFITESHAKCIIISYNNKSLTGVAGGRNFNDSSSIDATFEINEEMCKQLGVALKPAWNNSFRATDDNINNFINNLNFSVTVEQ